MQTLEALKRKTKSADDLQSVVRTMKALAAVSIRQYEQAVDSLEQYSATIEEGLRMVLWQAPPEDLPSARGRSDRRRSRVVTGAVVFGSDEGLCGQFNEQIARFTAERLQRRGHHRNAARVLAVGLRAANSLRDHDLQVDGELSVPGTAAGITAVVQRLLMKLEAWRAEHRIDRILLYYNRRQSASTYRPHGSQLLPIPEEFRTTDTGCWTGKTLPAFTMDRRALLSALVQQFLFVRLFRACAESLAGENASRIASMQSAERNIGELLAELRQQYNQRRQDAITEELLDVVTGFEVLSSRK